MNQADAWPHAEAAASRRRRRIFVDRLGRFGAAAAGVGVAAAVLWMMLFLVLEAWPLAGGAVVRVARTVPLPDGRPGPVITDQYRSLAVLLGGDGVLRVRALRADSVPLPPPREITPAPTFLGQGGSPEQRLFVVGTARGTLGIIPVGFDVRFSPEGRIVTPEILDTIWLEVDPNKGTIRLADAWSDAGGAIVSAALLADGNLVLVRRGVRKNLLTGQETVRVTRSELSAPSDLTALVVGPQGRSLFGGTASGELYWWAAGGGPSKPIFHDTVGTPVRVLRTLLGGRTLVVGGEDGTVQVWLPLGAGDGLEQRLIRVRALGQHAAPIARLAPSLRDRSVLSLDDQGGLALHFSTTGRTLWSGNLGTEPPAFASFAPRGDGALVWGGAGLLDLEIENPHPEATVGTLFDRVWYESYDRPAHVWQSSSASDDFEPKLSLTPLIVGTLKGTLYSLALAIPLAVLAAIYVSHFMSRRLRDVVKPIIEILAALPSVVLGFLAGLWLAPRLEEFFPALLAVVVILPVIAVGAGILVRTTPAQISSRLPRDWEVLAIGVLLALGIWLSIEVSDPISELLFAGNFSAWLYRTTGVSYEQRNALVVGIAMGFAVIPIIFSVAEEALSNVPETLVAGARALGANLWQTVMGVVLPAAGSGIFSAVMLGFGRAVGETMIVLMASGNTPILDWSIFNGFRTLSANIAVEIPEAPQGGTLYRTLFVSALLLFAITFVVNTAAEVIRHRLRTRMEGV
jgi:phosphate transport system permease protein